MNTLQSELQRIGLVKKKEVKEIKEDKPYVYHQIIENIYQSDIHQLSKIIKKEIKEKYGLFRPNEKDGKCETIYERSYKMSHERVLFFRKIVELLIQIYSRVLHYECGAPNKMSLIRMFLAKIKKMFPEYVVNKNQYYKINGIDVNSFMDKYMEEKLNKKPKNNKVQKSESIFDFLKNHTVELTIQISFK
jgi:DNA-binding ferritin-like protein (Dps family)